MDEHKKVIAAASATTNNEFPLKDSDFDPKLFPSVFKLFENQVWSCKIKHPAKWESLKTALGIDELEEIMQEYNTIYGKVDQKSNGKAKFLDVVRKADEAEAIDKVLEQIQDSRI